MLLDGQNVELSAREFDLLAFLMHAPGGCSPGSRSTRASGDTTIRVAPRSSISSSRRCARSSMRRATRSSAPCEGWLHGASMTFRLRLTLLFVGIAGRLGRADPGVTYLSVQQSPRAAGPNAATQLARPQRWRPTRRSRSTGSRAPVTHLDRERPRGRSSATLPCGGNDARRVYGRRWQATAAGMVRIATAPTASGARHRRAQPRADPERPGAEADARVRPARGDRAGRGRRHGARITRPRPVDRMREEADEIPGQDLDRRPRSGETTSSGRLAAGLQPPAGTGRGRISRAGAVHRRRLA